ncbi:hypothetical protein TIFTF001_009211 [Ficus carica]|uniref:Uncharacterized protein n=1 Tax=Ficus carica TaxID=3494 RepID=A0AA87ZUV9_FICCA|nr:hypothetical protein TIFTF001_009211 [Ficus carica]
MWAQKQAQQNLYTRYGDDSCRPTRWGHVENCSGRQITTVTIGVVPPAFHDADCPPLSDPSYKNVVPTRGRKSLEGLFSSPVWPVHCGVEMLIADWSEEPFVNNIRT